jgi:uncharacterized protein YndB with AHSA1/START domain
MKRLHFSTAINAPRHAVWKVLWDDLSFRDWTSAFAEGSHAISDWHEGSPIQFLAPGGTGMSAVIETKRPNELMSFRHIAEIKDGKEQPPAEWSGALETYRLEERDGSTTLSVELDAADEYREMFETTFPKALARVKTLAESAVTSL